MTTLAGEISDVTPAWPQSSSRWGGNNRRRSNFSQRRRTNYFRFGCGRIRQEFSLTVDRSRDGTEQQSADGVSVPAKGRVLQPGHSHAQFFLWKWDRSEPVDVRVSGAQHLLVGLAELFVEFFTRASARDLDR